MIIVVIMIIILSKNTILGSFEKSHTLKNRHLYSRIFVKIRTLFICVPVYNIVIFLFSTPRKKLKNNILT